MDKVEAVWRKSSYSGANGGNCVEVADGPGAVLVRDSKNPDGPRLSFRLAMWEAFTASMRADARSVLSRPGPASVLKGALSGAGFPFSRCFEMSTQVDGGATRVTLGEIRAMEPRLAELCRKYGIAELSVFGSVARGDAQPDNDVDLLYVRVPGNDLGMSYFALQEDLEHLFGRPVDLVSKEGLHRVIRDQVLADAQVLYAA